MSPNEYLSRLALWLILHSQTLPTCQAMRMSIWAYIFMLTEFKAVDWFPAQERNFRDLLPKLIVVVMSFKSWPKEQLTHLAPQICDDLFLEDESFAVKKVVCDCIRARSSGFSVPQATPVWSYEIELPNSMLELLNEHYLTWKCFMFLQVQDLRACWPCYFFVKGNFER